MGVLDVSISNNGANGWNGGAKVTNHQCCEFLNENDRPVRQWFPARVRWWITGTHELDALKLDPGLVVASVEAAVFHHLPQERDDALCACC